MDAVSTEPISAERELARVEVLPSSEPDTYRLRLVGVVDLSQASRVARHLLTFRDAAIALDVSQLRLIDTSGVRALLRVKNHMERRGLAFSVTGAHGLFAQVFDICGLQQWVSE